jgi:hypothetical protein
MGETSGWQLSGDAPTAYTRFALKIMEPWTIRNLATRQVCSISAQEQVAHRGHR